MRVSNYTLEQIINRPIGTRNTKVYRKAFAEKIRCKDGTTLSVQASRFHHCTPRNNEGPWSKVEVGFPSATPPLTWKPYQADDDADIYSWVPVELVREYIESHGGEA